MFTINDFSAESTHFQLILKLFLYKKDVNLYAFPLTLEFFLSNFFLFFSTLFLLIFLRLRAPLERHPKRVNSTGHEFYPLDTMKRTFH